MPGLRVLAGTSLDALVPITEFVNTNKTFKFPTSDRFEGEVICNIKGFEDGKESTRQRSSIMQNYSAQKKSTKTHTTVVKPGSALSTGVHGMTGAYEVKCPGSAFMLLGIEDISM
ncbi:hypothetical protein K435DRAFT_810536 [Dendrothele bispora CBS 962.96]|uniref:Uncharacterized protein n=1 Tax=Dendrothele bispora (strain CBS 962.96) TaxID=1314807 RepID=A0A4S8KVW2_DENBC|nr:hypothetical protein K435DRAFT_810536 [Dendrothele bispora CBS 962.96]